MVTLAYQIDERWQADLMDLSRFEKYNNKFKYILVCIDILSRYAFGEPLKEKTGENIIKAFKKIFKSRKPKILTTDQGREFNNKKVKNFLKEKDIKYMTTTTDDTKCAVIERFIRTLKEKIWKYLNYKNSYRYIDNVQNFISAYNKSIHRILKMKPSDVTQENEKEAFHNLYAHIRPNVSEKTKFFEDSLVRIAKKKEKYEKGADPNFTEEIFKIYKVNRGNTRPYYKIKDQLGEEITSVFYPEELQQTSYDSTQRGRVEKIIKKRRVGKNLKAFVKWKGYSDKFNSWIPYENITNGR
ncbi:hypothetical protein B4U79_13692 [Dinothrombium tinctorium]|uniref:Uncharacterized protein n=1 Tax=Dinothrombium tinctorium TaxID=1965070 RepID=A0A443Q7H6_9ACAR|nr:hypothetical protein B4U79_13692 [Dinothrombium tinctorium]